MSVLEYPLLYEGDEDYIYISLKNATNVATDYVKQ